MRLLAGAVALVALLLLASQLILPGVVAGKIEDRLTAHGGTAHVEISAFPAVGLLFDRGDRIEVRGSGVRLDLRGQPRDALDRLDGFGDVDVRLDRLTAGPLEHGRLGLSRSGGRDSAFGLTVSGEVTPAGLARYAGRELGGPLGGLVGDLAGGVLPFGDEQLPVNLDAALVRARDGGVRITDGGGSVAGVPLGPLAELIVEALAARL